MSPKNSTSNSESLSVQKSTNLGLRGLHAVDGVSVDPKYIEALFAKYPERLTPQHL